MERTEKKQRENRGHQASSSKKIFNSSAIIKGRIKQSTGNGLGFKISKFNCSFVVWSDLKTRARTHTHIEDTLQISSSTHCIKGPTCAHRHTTLQTHTAILPFIKTRRRRRRRRKKQRKLARFIPQFDRHSIYDLPFPVEDLISFAPPTKFCIYLDECTLSS